jgi:hypothetical protein
MRLPPVSPHTRCPRPGARVLLVLLAISVLIACRQHSSSPEARARVESSVPLAQTYVATAGAVKFDILPMGGTEDAHQWLASYTDEGRTTRFRIELGQQGKFLAETGSDPLPLLDSLQKALGAKRMPQNVKQADVLPFDYEVLGEDQTRSADGSFTDKPKGTWTALKVLLAHGKGEVSLNLNLADHQGEFAVKDAKYGDIVLAELARVF